MKLILDVVDGIIKRVQRADDSVISSVTTEYPYYSENDAGNGYAVSLRKRDLLISRGKDAEVLVLPDGDPNEYIFKSYDKKKKHFKLAHSNDEERNKFVSISKAKYRIASEDANLYPNQDQSQEMETVLGSGFYAPNLDKILKYVEIADEDKAYIELKLGQMSVETRHIIINQVANNIVISSDRMPMVSRWWGKLIGTPHELKGRTAIAAAYVVCTNYKMAVATYDSILSSMDLLQPKKKEITDVIKDIGRGEGLFDEAISIYQESDAKARDIDNLQSLLSYEIVKSSTKEQFKASHDKYDVMIASKSKEVIALCNQALSKLDEFDKVTSGMCKIDIGAKAVVLRAKLNGKIGRLTGNNDLIKKARIALSNPRGEKF